MHRRAKRKCLHCQQWFEPDYRNLRHQRYCHEPACRKASKTASQCRWLDKPENRDYFRGPVHVKRVQEWRKTRDGCGDGKPPKESPSLQEHCLAEHYEIKEESGNPDQLAHPQPAHQPAMPSLLQEFMAAQHVVLIGLIAHLTGCSLQDDIAITSRAFLQLGQDILANIHSGENHDQTSNPVPRTPPPHTTPLQLGGSPVGTG